MPEMNERDNHVCEVDPCGCGQSWTFFEPFDTTASATESNASDVSARQPTSVTKSTSITAVDCEADKRLREAQTGTKETYRITTEIVRQAIPHPDLLKLCRDVMFSEPIQHAIQGALPTSVAPSSSATGGEFEYPTMFRHVCLCDPKLNGAPIRYRSKNFSIGPRTTRVGQHGMVNPETQLPLTEGHMTLNIRLDSRRHPRYVLEYTTPLLSTVYREAKWILASQMDITDIANQLSIRLLMASDRPAASRSESSEQSVASDSIATQCSEAETSDSGPEEQQPYLTECNTQLGSFAIASDEPNLLDFQDLAKDVRYYHKDCFVMTESTYNAFWTVSWLSPSLLEGPDALQNCTINLRGSDSDTLDELGHRLDSNLPFNITVRWGLKAETKRVYAVPLWCSDRERCFLCFLIPNDFPLLRTFYE